MSGNGRIIKKKKAGHLDAANKERELRGPRAPDAVGPGRKEQHYLGDRETTPSGY